MKAEINKVLNIDIKNLETSNNKQQNHTNWFVFWYSLWHGKQIDQGKPLPIKRSKRTSPESLGIFICALES